MANPEKDMPVWCARFGHWKLMEVCLDRKRRKKHGCANCKAPEEAMQVELPKAEPVRSVRRGD